MFVVATLSASRQGHASSHARRPAELLSLVRSPLPEYHIEEHYLPAQHDWRDVGGKSYVTTDVNQHIPEYCGSCWVHGTVAALNDRVKVMRGGAFPDVMLSRQALINCIPDDSRNKSKPPPGCNGGDAWMVHSYLTNSTVGDETCQPYEARNGVCNLAGVCRNCASDKKEGCWGVPSFTGFGVSEYGTVSGEKAMMKEILARGPIVCGVVSDGPFLHNYSQNAGKHEGVYIDRSKHTPDDIDHDVSVTGWGVTRSGVKYWIIRNSWGTYWGEGGWFRLERGINSLMIEEQCDWAVPSFGQLEERLDGPRGLLGDYNDGLRATSMDASQRPTRTWPIGWAGLSLLQSEQPSLFQAPPAAPATSRVQLLAAGAAGFAVAVAAMLAAGGHKFWVVRRPAKEEEALTTPYAAH